MNLDGTYDFDLLVKVICAHPAARRPAMAVTLTGPVPLNAWAASCAGPEVDAVRALVIADKSGAARRFETIDRTASRLGYRIFDGVRYVRLGSHPEAVVHWVYDKIDELREARGFEALRPVPNLVFEEVGPLDEYGPEQQERRFIERYELSLAQAANNVEPRLSNSAPVRVIE
jgi:hypothetical protein